MHLFAEHFKREKSRIYTLDARVKLIFTLVLLAMVLSYNGFFFLLFILVASAAICLRLRLPLKVFLLRFCEPLFIAGILILLKFFFSGETSIFTLNFAGFKIIGYSEGLYEGLRIACRILAAVSIVAILGFTTLFTELIAALSWLKAPKGFIEILMFAYRYIFVLSDEAQVIYNAQKNRLGYSNVRRGLSSFGILSGSLVLKAFEHNQNLTVAMIQRGYDGNIPVLKHKPFKAHEIILSAATIALFAFIWKI
ncbi:MAG: cobalt ECF transporter T component CbiQ [Candidatus Omnitrophota bacterium]